MVGLCPLMPWRFTGKYNLLLLNRFHFSTVLGVLECYIVYYEGFLFSIIYMLLKPLEAPIPIIY
jgi:hypothetical protein